MDMLRELTKDNKAFTANMREAHEVASNNNDSATTSPLETFIDETEEAHLVLVRNDPAHQPARLKWGRATGSSPAPRHHLRPDPLCRQTGTEMRGILTLTAPG
jgi:hypothetical protein